MKRVLLTALYILMVVAGQAQQIQTERDDEQVEQELLAAYGNAAERSSRYAFAFLRPVWRGYDYRWRKVVLNGVVVNDPQTGAAPWAALGAALSSADYESRAIGFSFTDQDMRHILLGTESYSFDALEREQAGAAITALSNRTYSYRLQGSYDLISHDSSWALGINISRRWGHSMTTQGVFADATGLTITAAEAANLTGDPLYNPAWGRWNDRRRSTNTRRTIEPIVVLNHTYDAGSIRVENALYATGGRSERSALTWASAPNPIPDYWAAMPSAQETEHEREELTKLWLNYPTIRQIDFDRLISTNKNSPTAAHYAIEKRMRDMFRLTAQSSIHGNQWSLGAEFTYLNSDNYKEMEDLLGGKYWHDVDSFLEQDDDLRELTLNNMRNPNSKITKGDRFGYSYTLSTIKASIWGSWKHEFSKQWRVSIGGSASGRIDQRIGHYEKQNFPTGRSYGASDPLGSWEHQISAWAAYTPSGRFSISGALGWQSVSPTGEDMLLSPRYRNAAAPFSRSFTLLSGEIFARYSTPSLRLDARAYYTGSIGQTAIENMYDDLRHMYVHYAMSEINTSHVGFEFFAEFPIASDLYGSVAVVAQDSRYTSNPRAEVIRESTGKTEAINVEILYDGLHIGSSASQMASLGLSYRPLGWIAELRLNGFSGGHATPSPIRRTYDALRGAASPAEMSRMQGQEELPGGITLDLFVGRTWMLARGGRSVGLYAGVNNILNNDNIITTAYESGRLRNRGSSYRPAYETHPTKYYRAVGVNFFVNLGIYDKITVIFKTICSSGQNYGWKFV